MILFLLGRGSGRRSAYRQMGQRPRIGVGFVLAWLLIIGACIAFWQWFLLIGVPIIVALVALGASTSSRGNQAGRAPAPGPVSPTEPASETVVMRARCDHCGAPRAHGAEACRHCGRSLVVARATVA